MKQLLTVLCLALSLPLLAQTDTLFNKTELSIEITAIDFDSSKGLLMDFIKRNQVSVQYLDESKNSVSTLAYVSKAIFDQFNAFAPSLGYISSRKVNTSNNRLIINDIQLEIDYLNEQKASYENLLGKLDNKSDQYLNLWSQNKATEQKIFAKEKELLPYLQKNNNYSISLNLYQERTSPESSGVVFVNMPGFEYSYLSIENPQVGISAQAYQGYFLKYLFTKGKSFALAGAYKSINADVADSSYYSELFVLGFGQDFYSRHLGRGSRKFLNLYSGYTLGYILATGEQTKANIAYLSPTVGLELFKNRYVLLDTKAAYFIPLSHNKNLRGFSLNASFSFMF